MTYSTFVILVPYMLSTGDDLWSVKSALVYKERTEVTTVKTLSTSTSSQSDDTSSVTTVERLSTSPSSQSDDTSSVTTVERLSTSPSSQSDDTSSVTTVERLSTSPSSQSDGTDFGYTTTSVYMESDCFEIKTLFGTNHKDENDPLLMLITNDNTITSKVVVALICQNSHRDYNWDLWRKLQNGTYIKDKYFANPGNQPKSAAISFGKESIPEGNYLLRMVVNLTDSGQFLEDEIYIEYKLPPIITSIQGGSVRYISKYNDLVIDAGPVTYDKVQKYKSVPFNYEWCCRKGLNQSQVDTVLGKFGLPGAPDIITLGTSCNESSWGAKWTIPSENLTLDTWYLLHVKTKKITNIKDKNLLGSADTIRSATALQAVKVQIGHAPTINILCRKNCLPKLSLNSLLILNADCPECSLSDTKYEWSILVYNHTTEVFDSLNSVPRINQSLLIVTSLTADEIGIRTDAFREMDRIRFHLLIRTPGRSKSEADYIVSVNAPPYGGSCSITPNTGITVKTKFTIACKNWFDEGYRYIQNRADDGNELLTYSIYHVRNTTTGIAESLLSEGSSIITTLAVGDPENNFHSIIRVNIIDFYNGYTTVDLQVTVNNVINTDRSTQSDTELINTITELVNDGMIEARISNDPKQIIYQASIIVASIALIPIQPETFNTTDNPLELVSGLLEATKNGTKPYDDILNDLLKYYQDPVKVVIVQAIENLTKEMEVKLMSDDSTFYMTEMATTAFATALSDNKLVNNFAGISGSNALTNLATSLKNASETALLTNGVFDSSDLHLDSTSTAIMTLVSAVVGTTLTSNFPEKSLPLISATTADARKQVDFFVKMYGDDAYSKMEDSELSPEERTGLYLLRARISQAEFEEKQILASLTDTSIDTALQVMNDQGLNMICKGCKTIFNTKHVNLYIIKARIQESSFSEVPNDILQNSTIPMRLGDMNDITSLGIADFPQNVYIAGSSDTALVTSNVHKLFLKDKNYETFIPANFMVAINQTTRALQFSQNIPVYTEGDASNLFYHSFFYRDNGDYVCVSVLPVQGVPDCVTSYDVYVKFDSQPTHLNYDAKGRTSPDNDRMICFPPQLFSSTGEMHVALHANSKVGFGSLGYVWEPITGRYANMSYNISEPELMPYNLHIVTSNCKEWDPKRQSWDSINCEMDWFPRQDIIECTCRPAFGLTFGNTFYVAPNTIDFSTVFLRFDITNQGPVIGTIITILVIYVLLLIWARHQDKRDIARWGVTPLIDNFVDDTYYYLVTVYTGMRRGAGTKSRIGFIIHGKDGGTGIRELYDGVRSEIPAASVVHFLMSTPYPLGDLSYVYIWHDNSGEGESSSWYLTRVDVEDIQKRERFIFLCGKWLCLDTVDSSVDAILPVCGKENVTTFSNMFTLKIKENLADNHMWISIFFRPTSSHYTRCQRLTCFLLFVFLTMIGNAIYFRDEDQYSNAGSDIHVGPFSFSLTASYIALISALISTPTTLLVILMFSKSKYRETITDTTNTSRKYRIPVLDFWLDRILAESRELEKPLVSKGLFNTESTIFPYWFQYIAWILALSGIGACSVFLSLYSVEWGKNKSERWLGQFFLSFFSSIFLLDPLKIIVMSAVFAMLVKQTNKFRPTGLERSFILKNYRHTLGYKISK
ncbi:polycystin family receptor for egg jelly-like [Mytilus edulis]|uniref:polycystin family receptor for egg jelly-like n=1 Tax=Mytilus edulis TaxID=6550 RepID=UPI0039EDF405